ncbi:MAG: Ubiquinone/menaquinone biosynthesis C-methyltransferase UbiE, partial [Alphaproteobacteria bacterium MarineAlpha2_Bin1]
FWSSLKRINQELLFDNVNETIYRQLDKFSLNINQKNWKFSKIKLSKKITAPKYITSVDIHCMPGGYTKEISKDDISLGTMYDTSLYLYSKNSLGTYNDDMAKCTCTWIKSKFPCFKPKKILDMGCGVGNNSIPYKELFNNARVYGIDISAPMLRYAYVRSNLIKKDINFFQQNAEKTEFGDESFDLIVSHLLTHETSLTAFNNIINECMRLLTNHGIMIHVETDWGTENSITNKLLLDWETHYNSEPFKTTHDQTDKYKLAKAHGFKQNNISITKVNSLSKNKYYNGRWNLFTAIKEI